MSARDLGIGCCNFSWAYSILENFICTQTSIHCIVYTPVHTAILDGTGGESYKYHKPSLEYKRHMHYHCHQL